MRINLPGYNSQIMERNRHPVHRHTLEHANYSGSASNPACGDTVSLAFRISPDRYIEAAAYTGEGCAISQASTDFMLDLVVGRTTDDACRLGNSFLRMLHGDAAQEEIDSLGAAACLRDITRTPSRMRCALLGWNALQDLLSHLK